MAATSTNGKYTVQLIATSGSVSDTMTKVDYITVDDNMSVNIPQNSGIVGPIPGDNRISIFTSVKETKPVVLFNLLGKPVLETYFQHDERAINTSELAEGQYTLHWTGDDNTQYWTTVIICH